MRNVMSAIIANATPVIGVYFWGWSTFEFFIAYWFEAVIVGIFTFLRILCAQKALASDTSPAPRLTAKQKAGYGVFFVVWYAIFLAFFLFFVTFETFASRSQLFSLGNLFFWIPVGMFLIRHIVLFATQWSQKVFDALGPDKAFMPAIKWVVAVCVILFIGGFFSLKNSDGKVFVIVFFLLKSAFEIHQLRKMNITT